MLFNTQKKISDIDPRLSYDGNLMLLRTGQVAQVYEITLPPLYSISTNEIESMGNTFNDVLKALPNYSVMHKMDIYQEDTYRFNVHRPDNIHNQSYKLKYNEAPVMVHKCYLVIGTTSKTINRQTSLTSSLFATKIAETKAIEPGFLDSFKLILDRVEQLFETNPLFQIKALSAQATNQLCNDYLNLNFFNDTALTSGIYQDKNQTKIGKNFISTLAVNDINHLPLSYSDTFIDPNYKTDTNSLKTSMFYPIGLAFKSSHIVNTVFIKKDRFDVKQELKKITSSYKNFLRIDAANEDSLLHTEEFIQNMEKNIEPIAYHCNVMVWDTQQSILDAKVNQLEAAFSKLKITPNNAFFEVLPLYWSCFPGNIANIGVNDQTFYLLDRQAVALNSWETTRADNIGDYGLFLTDRSTNCPVFVDISDAPKKAGLTNNYNKIIFGPSGSGKSFFTNHLLRNYIESNCDVLVVDIGNSYKRLNKLKKGAYFTYEKDAPLAFNPFDIVLSDYGPEKKDSLITLLFTLWKKDPDSYTQEERSILSESILEYYNYVSAANSSIRKCFDTYFEFMKSEFIPNYILKEDKTTGYNKETLFDINSFLTVLKAFYKDAEYGYLLNSEVSNNLIDLKFIVFELDNIQDNPTIFPVVTLMIMDTFISKMRFRKGIRKVILIEEAWKAVSKEGMALFLKYLYKTARKHNGEAILVTQEVTDIVNNEMVKDAVIKNCAAKILLDMREYSNSFKEIQTMLSLDNAAAEQVLSLNQNNTKGDKYKEVFIGLANQGGVYGVNLSDVEYATYTTDKTETEEIELLEKQYNSLEQAIILFAEKRNNQRQKSA